MGNHVQTLLTILLTAVGALAGPAEAVSAAAADAGSVAKVSAEAASYLRYFELDHLETPKDRQELWQLLSALFNGTSQRKAIARPVVILLPKVPGVPLEIADGLLIAPADWGRAVLARIDYADYGYKREVIETLALVEPHFHGRERKQQETKVKVGAPAAAAPEVLGFDDPTEFKHPPLAAMILLDCPEDTVVWVDGKRMATSRSFITPDLRPGRSFYRIAAEFGGKRAVRDVLVSRGEVLRLRLGLSSVLPRKEVPAPEAPEGKADAKSIYSSLVPIKEFTDLRTATNSDSPIQQADWAWWQMSVQAEREPGPGYYDLLAVKNQDEFWERVGYDKKLFEKRFAEFVREYRAAVGRSGVAREPRRVSVEDKIGPGPIWITFDNKLAKNERNPLETPNGGFLFDATEQMAHLPNKWLAQGLFAADGTRQDTAPDFIGPDKTATGNDGRIHCGICWRCHAEGIRPINNWFEKQFRLPVKQVSPDYLKNKDFREQYFGQLVREIPPSVALHAAAVKEATGLTLAAYSALIAKHWKRTEDDGVSMKRASRDFGVTTKVFQAALRALKAERDGKEPLEGLSTVDMWLRDEKDQEPVPVRQYWDATFEIQKALGAGRKP